MKTWKCFIVWAWASTAAAAAPPAAKAAPPRIEQAYCATSLMVEAGGTGEIIRDGHYLGYVLLKDGPVAGELSLVVRGRLGYLTLATGSKKLSFMLPLSEVVAIKDDLRVLIYNTQRDGTNLWTDLSELTIGAITIFDEIDAEMEWTNARKQFAMTASELARL